MTYRNKVKLIFELKNEGMDIISGFQWRCWLLVAGCWLLVAYY
jgi:hypothetical protein